MIRGDAAVARRDIDVDAGTTDYRAFGLSIRSEIPLPELSRARFDAPDLTILRRATSPDFPPPDAPLEYDLQPGVLRLMWPNAGCFRIVGDAAIEVEAAPGVDDRLLAFPLLGPVVAVLCHLRDMLVLHGSAIAMDGCGVAFLGDKMAGKSTTAAAFVAAGHRLLTDDVLAIAMPRGMAPRIAPAFAQIKLSDAAAEAIPLEQADVQPLILPDFPKRQHRVGTHFSHEETVPRRIYILRRGDRAAIRRLAPPEALAALMRFSYVNKIIARMLTPELERRHFRQVAALASCAAVCELETPGEIARLDEAVTLVEDDLAGD